MRSGTNVTPRKVGGVSGGRVVGERDEVIEPRNPKREEFTRGSPPPTPSDRTGCRRWAALSGGRWLVARPRRRVIIRVITLLLTAQPTMTAAIPPRQVFLSVLNFRQLFMFWDPIADR
jgi:hypothetical protein